MLDLLRAIAAQMVCVGHGLSFFVSWATPARLPRMQNVGVLLFFMLSGFLITHTLIERSKSPTYGFRQFFIERFARIYSGLIPALGLIVLVDGITVYLTGNQTIARYYNVPTLLANLIMLEDYRGALDNYDALQWSAFGSASPLWTLAIEWHIYLFTAAIFFIGTRSKWIPVLILVAIIFGQMPCHYLVGAISDDGVGRGLFALWLGGSLIYFAIQKIRPLYWPAFGIAVLAVVLFIITTPAGMEYRFEDYAMMLVFFLAVMLASQARHLVHGPLTNKVIRFFADYSFTLYLVHHTIMVAIWTISSARGLPIFVGAVVLSNLLAIGLARIGENHHRLLAAKLTPEPRPDPRVADDPLDHRSSESRVGTPAIGTLAIKD